MRRLPLAVAAAAAVLTLAACTASPTPADTDAAPASSAAPVSSAPASSAPASASAEPEVTPTPLKSGSPEQRFLAFVQQFSPTLAQRDPAVLLALGKGVCSNFAAGKTATQVASALGDDPSAPDLNAEDGSVIIGAAVAVLCPKYRDKLTA